MLNAAEFRNPATPGIPSTIQAPAWDGPEGDRDEDDPNPKALLGEAAGHVLLSMNTPLMYCCAAFSPRQYLPLAQALLPVPAKPVQMF